MTIDIELPSDVAVASHRVHRVASEQRSEGQNVQERLARLIELAMQGLALMYQPENKYFPHTMRGVRSADGPQLRPEGDNLRYAAIVALGLATLPTLNQRHVLAGEDASQLARTVAARAVGNQDPGLIALAAWAAAEVAGEFANELFNDLKLRVANDVS